MTPIRSTKTKSALTDRMLVTLLCFLAVFLAVSLSVAKMAVAQGHQGESAPNASVDEKCKDECHRKHCDCVVACNGMGESPERAKCKDACEERQARCRNICGGASTQNDLPSTPVAVLSASTGYLLVRCLEKAPDGTGPTYWRARTETQVEMSCWPRTMP